MKHLLSFALLAVVAVSAIGCGGGEVTPSTATNGVAPPPSAEIPKAPGKPTGAPDGASGAPAAPQ